jgi:hypothetical protein
MVRNGVLSLKGEKKSRDEQKVTCHLVERSYGAFERSFGFRILLVKTRSRPTSRKACFVSLCPSTQRP